MLKFRSWLLGIDWVKALGFLLVPLLGVGLRLFSFGQPLSLNSYDWLLGMRRSIPVEDVLIVGVGETTFETLKLPQNRPMDRRVYAKLVDHLTKAGARAVAFDVVFKDRAADGNCPENPEEPCPADVELARAIQANGRVVLAADAHMPRATLGNPERDGVALVSEGPTVDLPHDTLLTAVAQADGSYRYGTVLLKLDFDQVVRLMPPTYLPDKPSLSWKVAEVLGAPVTKQALGHDVVQEGEDATNRDRWMNYYGPGQHLPIVLLEEVLGGAVPDERIRDRVVFVGSITKTKLADERKDYYVSPYSVWVMKDQEAFMDGVEIQATAARNYLRGEWLERSRQGTEIGMAIGLGIAACAVLFRLRPARALLAALAMLVVLLGVAYVLFAQARLWIPWLLYSVQIASACALSISANSIRLYVQNRLLQQTVARYLSPKLARKYLKERDLDFLRPGAVKHELTIFFSDIAGFTTISEGMDSSHLAMMMNRYFDAAVGGCIHPTDGTVVKYIGDAIFAFWNAPDPQPDHAERACRAALLFRQESTEKIAGHALVTRIGLHTGNADVGNFGSQDRVDYTALGENINLASRLEGLNKHLGTRTLMSGETESRIRGRFLTRDLGWYVLKGFEKRVSVHELVADVDKAAEYRALHEVFSLGLLAFQAQRWDEAEAKFREALKISEGDGPSQFYLRELERRRKEAPKAGWSGEVELTEK